MPNKSSNESDLWVGWTRDAMRSFATPEDLDFENDEAIDTLVDDMIDVATQYADAMLDEHEERFSAATGRQRRRRKRGGRRRGSEQEEREETEE